MLLLAIAYIDRYAYYEAETLWLDLAIELCGHAIELMIRRLVAIAGSRAP